MYINLCKLKQKVKFEDQKDVIYSVPCKDCKVRYVGETGQHFCDRVKQHQNHVRYKKSTNSFYAHLKSNKNTQLIGRKLYSWERKETGKAER